MTDTTPVRNAATLILTRSTQNDIGVLMGKRHTNAVFMPDKFVFPGGALDADDGSSPCPLKISASSLRRLGFESDVPAEALANAAIRECKEETGIDVPMLNTRLNGALELSFCYRAITPPGRPRRFDARFFRLHLPDLLDDPSLTFAGDGELSDLGWYPIATLSELPLADITRNVCANVFAKDRPDAVPFARRGSGASPDWIT